MQRMAKLRCYRPQWHGSAAPGVQAGGIRWREAPDRELEKIRNGKPSRRQMLHSHRCQRRTPQACSTG